MKNDSKGLKRYVNGVGRCCDLREQSIPSYILLSGLSYIHAAFQGRHEVCGLSPVLHLHDKVRKYA